MVRRGGEEVRGGEGEGEGRGEGRQGKASRGSLDEWSLLASILCSEIKKKS